MHEISIEYTEEISDEKFDGKETSSACGHMDYDLHCDKQYWTGIS